MIDDTCLILYANGMRMVMEGEKGLYVLALLQVGLAIGNGSKWVYMESFSSE